MCPTAVQAAVPRFPWSTLRGSRRSLQGCCPRLTPCHLRSALPREVCAKKQSALPGGNGQATQLLHPWGGHRRKQGPLQQGPDSTSTTTTSMGRPSRRCPELPCVTPLILRVPLRAHCNTADSPGAGESALQETRNTPTETPLPRKPHAEPLAPPRPRTSIPACERSAALSPRL